MKTHWQNLMEMYPDELLFVSATTLQVILRQSWTISLATTKIAFSADADL